MNSFIAAVITGITSFVATNIDDMVILTLFFAQINDRFRSRHIFLGQYLGFTVLLLASLPGFFGGMMIPDTWIGLLGILPIVIGIRQLLHSEDDRTTVQRVSWEAAPPKPQRGSVFSKLFAPQTYQVAAVTIANGGDNIGIYVPLFASSHGPSLLVILCTFFVLVGIWCYVARYVALHPAIAPVLTRYGQAIVPYILIGLGIAIMIENGTYRLLPNF